MADNAALNDITDERDGQISSSDEAPRKYHIRPEGAVVGVVPSRDKKLQFVSGESDPEADTRLRAMIENLLHISPYAVCITDMQKEEEPIVYANEMFCKWTEYPESFILGRNCRFLQGPESIPDTVRAMRKAINEGKEFRGVIRNYTRTGVHLWNNLVMSPVKNKDGFVTHYTGIQNFSYEPPNAKNTPAPPVDQAFNPLAAHVRAWQEKQATKSISQVSLKELSQPSGEHLSAVEDELVNAIEASAASLAPKIMPQAGAGVRDATMDKSSIPLEQLGIRRTDLASASSSGVTSPPRGSSSGSPRKGPAPSVPAVHKLPSFTRDKTPASQGSWPTQVTPLRRPRRRSSNSRREAGECTVVPDRDIWLELVVRTLSSQCVPMLPDQPEGPVEKSRAMTGEDFKAARKELGRPVEVHG
uniref:Putative LOV domain-containing protein n=1 Tax=Entransia fimbriata TaxID=130991 RepID=A0A126WVY6_9VIRI|nr:putative LOV domain-containing protein [Entransia fimbriata]